MPFDVLDTPALPDPHNPATVPEGVAGRGAARLGKSAKSGGRSVERTPEEQAHKARQERRRALELQREAARLVGGRVADCCWTPSGSSVSVVIRPETGRAGFSGLQSCGSPWVCPLCARRLAEERRQELREALDAARRAGFSVFLLTLTMRHAKGEALADTLGAFKAARKAWNTHRQVKAARGIVGTTTATELTWSPAASWHPHQHLLVFWKGPGGLEALEALRAPWLASLAGKGRDGNGAAFDVRDGSAAGDYVAKWGVASEMALGERKEGRQGSRTPWDLLADSREGDAQAAALFREYAHATHGRRALVMSARLRKALDAAPPPKVDEAKAAEVVEPQVPRVVFMFEGGQEWSRVRRLGRSVILEAAERGGGTAILALLAGWGVASEVSQACSPEPPSPPNRRSGREARQGARSGTGATRSSRYAAASMARTNPLDAPPGPARSHGDGGSGEQAAGLFLGGPEFLPFYPAAE